MKIYIDMKLKLIKRNEVIVKRQHWSDYEQALIDAKRLSNGVYYHEVIYKYDWKFDGSCIVYMLMGDNLIHPIKYFDSKDCEYNRVCAEELVELLNQKQ